MGELIALVAVLVWPAVVIYLRKTDRKVEEYYLDRIERLVTMAMVQMSARSAGDAAQAVAVLSAPAEEPSRKPEKVKPPLATVTDGNATVDLIPLNDETRDMLNWGEP